MKEMPIEVPIINILTYKLPYELANQIYNEFQARSKDANYFVTNYVTFSSLANDTKLIELILALAVFHRRVITNLDGVVKFHNTVTKKSNADVIKIGNYELNGDEKNKILAIVLNFNKILKNYSIPSSILEYSETKEFLEKLLLLKFEPNNA